MPIRRKVRVRRTAADRVLGRCGTSTVYCWHAPNVHGLELAAFLEFHAGAAFKVEETEFTENVGAVRFAYRNHKPVTLRFTRIITAGSDDTVIEPHGPQRQLSMIPARADALPYCEDIVPDLVHVSCDRSGDHVQATLQFVAPREFVRGGETYELSLRFPDTSSSRECPCC
jgi:hypothetical protein